MYWTDSMRMAALPLWTWLATVVAMTFGGPGGDIIFAGLGLMAYGSLIFIAAGALPPAAMLLTALPPLTYFLLGLPDLPLSLPWTAGNPWPTRSFPS